VLTYSVILDVPREEVLFVSRLLLAERETRGTRTGTRLLNCSDQAIYVIAWFRDKVDIPRLGAAFGLSRSTSYRYLDEGIEVLARQAPDLHQALQRATQEGVTHLILDGKVVDSDRLREKRLSRKGKKIDSWYAGKTHDFGGNIQALMNPCGIPLWLSEVLPGSVHDITAARRLVLAILEPYLKDMPVLADPGYQGAGQGIYTPVKKPKDGSELDLDTRTYNTLLRAIRALGERGFALLTQRWKTLQHVTMGPRKITKIARAALVLTHYEHKMITA
jgi:hypothetical protein